MFLWNTGLCSGDALCSVPANGRAVSKKQNKMNQPTKQETTKQKADFFKASYLGAYFTAAMIARSLA